MYGVLVKWNWVVRIFWRASCEKGFRAVIRSISLGAPRTTLIGTNKTMGGGIANSCQMGVMQRELGRDLSDTGKESG